MLSSSRKRKKIKEPEIPSEEDILVDRLAGILVEGFLRQKAKQNNKEGERYRRRIKRNKLRKEFPNLPL